MHLYKCTAFKNNDSVHVATTNQTRILFERTKTFISLEHLEKKSQFGLSSLLLKMRKNLTFKEKKKKHKGTNILHIKYGCQSFSN